VSLVPGTATGVRPARATAGADAASAGAAHVRARGSGRHASLPAFDRASKNFINAIKTLREFHSAGVNLTISQAAQVNVAEQQLVVGPSGPPSTG
jgi:hypothetical protein